MSLKDEIDKLWNESNDDLQKVIENAIKLLEISLSQNEDLPLETALDILLTANTTIGFGGEYDQAELLLNVYSIVLNSDNPDSIPKVYRFACLIFGVIYTLLSVDESTSDRKVPGIMKKFDVEENATRVFIIRKLLHSTYPLLSGTAPDYWKLELISFIITGLCLLDDFDDLTEEDLKIELVISKITKESTIESNIMVLNNWNSRWLEASDYFRLTSTLLFGKYPKDEDAWLNRVKNLTEDKN